MRSSPEGRAHRPRAGLFLAFVCALVPASARSVSPVSAGDVPAATPALLRELARGGEEIAIIVGVRDGTPSARDLARNPDPEGEPRRRERRLATQKRLAAEMTPQSFRPRFFYESFSMAAGTASREGAIALANHPDVAWVTIDRKARRLQSAPQTAQVLIGSDRANSFGFTGAGQAVAVIDTGVDYTISSLGGGKFPNAKVIGGTDVADNDADPMDCDGHGTEVAGIIAGPTGVAPDARIVAIKVFSSQSASNSSCADTSDFSTILSGINYAISNKATFNIAAINISLGAPFDDGLEHGYCDSDDPSSAAAIASATAAGIVVAVAGGNDALLNQLAIPACVSSAVSVGAVYSDSRTRVSWSDGSGGILCTDQPAAPDAPVCFSNSTSPLSLLAPGAFWKVAGKGGSTDSSFAGTSASTPAVAGAVALLRQARPDLTAVGLIAILRSTGKPITDPRNGLVTPRLDTLAAVQLVKSSFAVSSISDLNIPDGKGSVTETATVADFALPVGAVQAWVEIDHPEPEQLRLTLIGPDGTSVVLQDQTGQSEHPINAIYGKTDPTVQSLTAFSGKPANGTWTLKVEDLVNGVAGRVKAFSLLFVPLVERQSISKRVVSPARQTRPISPRS